MALITTFATTPLVLALYPTWYQTKLEKWNRGEIDWDGNDLSGNDKNEDGSASSIKAGTPTQITRLFVHLRLDTLPGVLGLVSVFTRPGLAAKEHVHPSKKDLDADASNAVQRAHRLQVQGIRLKELTDRSSSVMAVAELEEYSQHDHVLNTFRTFGQCSNVAVRGAVLLCPPDTYPETLAESASNASSDLVLLSWAASGSMSENSILPAESLCQRFENSSFSHFLSKTTSKAKGSNTAIFVDNGFGARRTPQSRPNSRKHSIRSLRDLESSGNLTGTSTLPPVDQGHHIFLPYFGTEDDRAALHLVLQMVQNPTVTATITLFQIESTGIEQVPGSSAGNHPITGLTDTSRNEKSTAVTTTTTTTSSATTTFYTLRDSLPASLASRVVFEIHPSSSSTSAPGWAGGLSSLVLAKAQEEVGQQPKNAGDLVVLGKNSGISATLGKGRKGNEAWMESEAGKTLGVVAGVMIMGQNESWAGNKGLGIGGSLLVVRKGADRIAYA